MFSNSPVDIFAFAGREIFLKRDDLLHPAFSGNKARKFGYFLDHEFIGITKVIGHGSPLANSLYSLSTLAKMKGWQCDFYVDYIASLIVKHPTGNYAAALANGVNIIDLSELMAQKLAFTQSQDEPQVLSDLNVSCDPALQTGSARLSCQEYIETQVLANEPTALFIPEGGRCSYAEYGVNVLAQEIVQFAQANDLVDLTVFLPSGTGTTALFLNQYFIRQQTAIRVVTCAVVGGDDYLRLQFSMLNPNTLEHPQIVNVGKKYHFGKLYPEFYAMWQRVCASGVQFELLYDPLGFIVLEDYLLRSEFGHVMYLHQGGILGNETMLPRYQRKFAGV
ncbi:1-aminocyclopropane-1-carboxylate deaminase/D-cysteine desulfhydrase [Shewanella baltica]|uniref:1-aminocyclopropane-1-carboxylate deaminase/D-cysteine desulfhydrase n=1 Tax=Shewanella baltica TaxID=62322 RepID=UPI00217E9DEB|nr:1-aminocyclopropane-1-carboxylate deaminase/D-cysteine desulfhydrase [Shewanella baltica]MCS6238988.1 1-aminocyclopropane-1-carboxylate deaminase/D-cysteine desulfhydrase [Shewanella baltica]